MRDRATGPNSDFAETQHRATPKRKIMKAFYNLRLATKLLASFIAVLALTVFVGVFSIMQLEKVNQMSTDITTNWMPATRALLEMKGLMSRYRAQELQHILSTQDAELTSYEKSMADTWNELTKTC